jgi:hypothetical protein
MQKNNTNNKRIIKEIMIRFIKNYLKFTAQESYLNIGRPGNLS